MTEGNTANRRWDLIGAVAGFAVGIGDLALLELAGVEMTWGTTDVTVLVVGFFALTFAGLGYLNGRLKMAGHRQRRDAQTIADQLDALEASQSELIQAEKLAAIGRLAAGVAHEVRNPLGVIRASASLLQEDADDRGDDWRACQFIVEEIDRLDAMISALLKFARPERLETHTSALEEPIERAIGLAEATRDGRQISIEHHIDAPLPTARIDQDLICQLLFGLMGNALSVLGPSGRIEVRAKPESGGIAVEVADSGPGIGPDEAERVFEPFYTTRDEGTGLGLAIAARIALAHGGHLGVVQGRGAGPEGKGACFRLWVPVGGEVMA